MSSNNCLSKKGDGSLFVIGDDKIVSSALELIDKLKKLSKKIQIFIMRDF